VKTRVCRLHGQKDLRIEEIALSPPGPGEALVRLGAGGICGSDLHYFLDGGFGPILVREPIILGHEASGIVEAAGPGIALAPGDRVALNPSRPCGACRFCEAGAPQHCLAMRFNGSAMRMPHEQGFFRERMVVPESQCVLLPAGTDLAAAACSEPLAVCMHAVAQAPALGGQAVLVTGSGPIGVLCAALAQRAGARRVVVTDLHDFPLEVARKMGAHETVNVAARPEALTALEAEKGAFDVTFECSAAAPALRSAILCTRPRGTIVQVGVTGDLAVPINLLVGKEIRLVGTHRFHGEFAAAVELIATGAIDVAPMLSARYPLAKAGEAIARAADRRAAVKVQIAF
jgi:L-idonate 5-dehydrogenase